MTQPSLVRWGSSKVGDIVLVIHGKDNSRKKRLLLKLKKNSR